MSKDDNKALDALSKWLLIKVQPGLVSVQQSKWDIPSELEASKADGIGNQRPQRCEIPLTADSCSCWTHGPAVVYLPDAYIDKSISIGFRKSNLRWDMPCSRFKAILSRWNAHERRVLAHLRSGRRAKVTRKVEIDREREGGGAAESPAGTGKEKGRRSPQAEGSNRSVLRQNERLAKQRTQVWS